MTSSTEIPVPRRRHYRAVILSPHLDDAVFSCAGAIAQLLREGPVLVINIFTRYESELKMRGVVLTDARYQEETDAAALLGFESINLNELDVSFRRSAYRALGNIFRPPVAEDLAWLPVLRDKVAGLLSTFGYDEIFVPLGIGWHVDHVLTYALFDQWSDAAGIQYYEDLPYCLLPHATRLRMRQLGLEVTSNDDLGLAPVPLLMAWRQAMQAYNRTAMMRNLRPWIVRVGAVPVVAVYLYRLLAGYQKVAEEAPIRPWRAYHRVIEPEFDLKLRTMALYESQFREFFVDQRDCTDSLRRYAGQFSAGHGVAERSWRLSGA